MRRISAVNASMHESISLKHNLLSSYVSQIYVAVIGIVMVPMYVKYLGAETYGLVAFFAMLQAWFQLLDIGLTHTMSRETARHRGGATDARTLRLLMRSLESIFIVVALLGSGAIIAGAQNISGQWLNVEQLPQDEVHHSIVLIALIIALRWLSSLYRGTITGFERLVWLSGFNCTIATARFVLVLPIFWIVGTSPVIFFTYQLAVASLELVGLVAKTYRLLPQLGSPLWVHWDWHPLRRVLKFSLGVAFGGLVWVLITQTDKLILSKLLSLSDYAYFTLAVLVASGILLVSIPVGAVLLPRLSRLNAERDETGLIRLYRNTTQLVGITAFPAVLVLALFPEQVLWAWTGDGVTAAKAASVLPLYAIGNGLLALAAFPYYLQFAKGDLKLHLIGNALFVVLFVPLLIWATINYGMIGAGHAWIVANILPFFTWLPLVHLRFARGLHVRWFLEDILQVALLPIALALICQQLIEWPTSRFIVAVKLVTIGLVLCGVAAVGSSWLRKAVIRKWRGGQLFVLR